MRTIKLLMMAVLLGAGFTSCDKEDDDIRPMGVRTEPIQPKPTEVGQEDNQGIGSPVSEMENPVHDEPR